MKDLISLPEVLDTMQKPSQDGGTNPFSVIVCKLDKKRNTCGQPIYYSNVRLQKSSNQLRDIDVPQLTHTSTSKNPNHAKNKTRNIILENGDVRTIHIRHITHFNDLKVIW